LNCCLDVHHSPAGAKIPTGQRRLDKTKTKEYKKKKEKGEFER
jgi:hypothetical protein